MILNAADILNASILIVDDQESNVQLIEQLLGEAGVEDMAVAMIKFENGAALELEASWAGNIREKEFMSTQLFGTEGGLVQRNIGEGYQFEAELYMQKNGCQYDMKLHPPVPQAQSPMYHFIDSIVNDTPHIATGAEGVVVMELLDAIYQSA
ncbi:Gfo/Idh/MocA family oxidoreductase, partial [Thioalkalivibrio sp.]|uniref:Gfo/Idh/MocA family oxidoreductase n=1 Tax=Thioalkalivibrio sp. TaxID=2093813 RepID=UPI003975E02D